MKPAFKSSAIILALLTSQTVRGVHPPGAVIPRKLYEQNLIMTGSSNIPNNEYVMVGDEPQAAAE